MMKRHTTRQILTAAGSAAMLAAFLLLPLVSLKGYGKGFFDLMRRGSAMVHDATTRTVALVLLLIAIAAPLCLAVRALLGAGRQRLLALLPIAISTVLIVVLLLGSKPVSPALGLWLYLAVALCVGCLHLRK